MLTHPLNSWDVTPAQAVEIQRALAPLVVTHDELGSIHRVAGVDVGFVGGRARAGVVVLSYPELAILEISLAEEPVRFPYVPGLLSFREAPAILAACERLTAEPDVVIVDGHGFAHPRRLGIASHLGLCLDKPTIGSAKSHFIGQQGPLGEEVGATAEIVDRGEIIAVALRTKARVKPVYVSIGHKVGLATAARIVLDCCRGYRLPEPQRQAHGAVSGHRGRPSGAQRPLTRAEDVPPGREGG